MNLRLAKKQDGLRLNPCSGCARAFSDSKFPDCKGLEVDALYLPSSQVGGDFYDFYKLTSTKFAVSIADVSGKGVPASLLMALCQTNLRHYVTKNRTPSEVLKYLNLELEKRIRDDMFITLFLAIIDTQSNSITYARAGHEPSLLGKRDEDGNVSKLHGGGDGSWHGSP